MRTFAMTLLKNLVLVIVFTLVIGDEHNHIVSVIDNQKLYLHMGCV